MKSAELAGTRSFLAPNFNEFSIFGKLHDPPARVRAVSVRDENVSVRGDHNVARIDERVRAITADACLAKRQQDSSLRIELDHLQALAVFRLPVGGPDVAVFIRVETVWIHKHSRAKARHQLAGGVKF